ncbi:MAG: protein kinase domain-containing protein [Oceanococcaceae bacterium]
MPSKGSSTGSALDRVLDAVLDLPAPQRREEARRLCGQDQALWTEVARLLDLDAEAGDFLQSGPSSTAPEIGSAPDGTPPSTPAGTRIGPWEVVGLIGRGGMGEVLEVRRADGQFDKRAALKRLHEASAEQTERLQRERQILAALQHPHIAQLLDGGVDEHGQPWMVMEYVRGQPLDVWAATATLEQRLEVFAQVLAAVAHAHAHLVVHRDLKPANILVDASGQAHLLDFGIAKLITALRGNDNTQALATPNFAAPEQLLGEAITVHTDIYGLGAVLYALLTGQPPLALDGLTLPSLVDRIRHARPEVPSRVAAGAGISADLDAVCLKCLAKRPTQRYASVTELAQDLQRLRSGYPVLARTPGWWEHLRGFMRRHRVVAVGASLIGLSVILGLVATSWQARRATLERDIARQETQRLQGLRSAVTQLLRTASEGESARDARGLFARTAAEAETRLGNDPATAAALLQMLGQLHLHNDDYPAAQALLDRVLALPAQQVSPTVRADAHIDMAHIRFRDRDLEATRQHIAEAMEIWSASPTLYRNERTQLLTLEAQLARSEGDLDRSVALLQQSVQEHLELWGRQHPQTANALVNLAANQYYANDVPAAIRTSEQAHAIYQALEQGRSPDALNLLANWGLYALRAGRPAEAEQRLSEALELRTSLYGASAAQAVLMKNLGLAHLANGREEDGLNLLEQSQWMAERYAGAESHLHAASACQLARIWIARQRPDAALATLSRLPESLFSRDSHWGDYCRGLRRLVAEGAEASVEAELQSLAQRGEREQIYRADLLAAQAYAHWQAGAAEQAADLFALAAADKAEARGDSHYETLELQLRRADALQASGQTETARSIRRPALEALRRALGPAHPLVEAELALSGPR